MPMKSQAQRRWMWKNKPEMARQWEDETPKGKKLPEKLKGKKKKDDGGLIGQFLRPGMIQPDPTMMAPQQPVVPGSILNPSTTPGMTIGPKQYDWDTRPVDPFTIATAKDDKVDPYFAAKGISNGLSWLSGIADRGRQNQYLGNQLSTLGQRNAMPVEDFQPNPFSMYAKLGGKLKKYEGGGKTPRKVDKVPDGYNPLRTETLPDGTVREYFNIHSEAPGASNVRSTRPTARSKYSGQRRATSGSSRPPQSIEDLIYIERGPTAPATPSVAAPVDQPAWAGRGEYIHRGKHMAGEIMYPSRRSAGQTDGGTLDTSAEDLMFQFRDDFGKGEMVPIKKSEIQKFFGTNNTFQDTDPAYSYDGLKSRSVAKKYELGGITTDALSYLFDDDEDEELSNPTPASPQEDPNFQRKMSELAHREKALQQRERKIRVDQSISLAMDGAKFDEEVQAPSRIRQLRGTSGNYGSLMQAGMFGKQIVNEISGALGYTPQFNSIKRTPEQQQKLVNQGFGVKNSYHLTGDAVDMKPADWNKLPKDKQQEFKNKYDVIYHNNHYHMEPRG